MGKKRVHELAKELGLDNKEVVQRLQAAGLDVKSHSSSVYEDEARAALGKPLEPVEVAPAPAVRRPGMMIVRKRKEDEVAGAVEAAGVVGAEGESAHEASAATVSAEHPAEVAPTGESDAPDASTDGAEGHDLHDARRHGREVESDDDDEASLDVATHRHAPVRVEAPAPRQTARPAAETEAVTEAVPAAIEAATSAPEEIAPQAADADANKFQTAKTRPGAATVVRMIDRDKLMERVPSRRLGSGPGERRPAAGAGTTRDAGQRFGQVTELKVVTDPFGRGREMINVGRDKKGKVTTPAAKVQKKERAPTKREMLEMRERAMHPSRLKRKKTIKRAVNKPELTERKASKRVIKMRETVVIADLAHELGVKASDVIGKLMALGTMVTQNQSINLETAQIVAAAYEYTVDSTAFDEAGALEGETPKPADENQLRRPPVVTVMGHVDHGKTSLLDAIRKAKVAAGEAGGITQHIGAYSVDVGEKGSVTFLDTPGHAAFTAMRARGAQATDLVVLVVAADDGVMPQTEEAIKHAQAAKVPIIVAVNKVDKPEASPERVMQELTKFELVPEAWGGETLYVNTSATKGTGIDELLEAILLQSEVLELTANPDRQAIGVVLEAKLDRGRGPVATLLVQQGTLRRGDAIVAGDFSGKVRDMRDDTGRVVNEAGPSAAVEVTGLENVPEAGDALYAVDSADKAREIAAHRVQLKRAQEGVGRTAMTLEDMMKRMKNDQVLELKVVLKADVQGSVEAVRDALHGLSTDEVKVNVIYAGVGGIKESDITLAAASKGIVLGFNVRPDTKSRELAEHEGVDIRSYSIIYEALDEIRNAMEGLLAPESREKVIGHAEVREVFKITKVGTIAGSRVLDGKALRSARVRVVRDSVQVFDGKVASLKHFKNDAREVEAGQECGVGVEAFNDIKASDVLEFYIIEEIARTLAPPSAAPGKRPSGGATANP